MQNILGVEKIQSIAFVILVSVREVVVFFKGSAFIFNINGLRYRHCSNGVSWLRPELVCIASVPGEHKRFDLLLVS